MNPDIIQQFMQMLMQMKPGSQAPMQAQPAPMAQFPQMQGPNPLMGLIQMMQGLRRPPSKLGQGPNGPQNPNGPAPGNGPAPAPAPAAPQGQQQGYNPFTNPFSANNPQNMRPINRISGGNP